MTSPAPAAPAITLRFETSVIRVTAPHAADLTWLADILACGFEAAGAAPPDAEACLRVDAAAHDAQHARGRIEHGADVEGFARDADRHFVAPWSTDAEARVVYDAEIPAFYRLARRRPVVDILARDGAHRCRMALLRVVRELAMDRVVASGGALVHGAAALTDSGVIAVSAPKRHGKTTLLMALLEHTAVAYVSNDRCVLRVGDGGATLRGLPTIVSITRHGLDGVPNVRERLFAERPALARSGDASVGLGPHEFVRALAVRRASCGPAAAFLFPRVTAQPQRLTLRRLAAGEALERFRAGLFRTHQPTLLGEVFTWEAAPGLTAWQAGERAGRWVSEHLPCFEVALGGGAPPNAADCRALLDAIAAARRTPAC